MRSRPRAHHDLVVAEVVHPDLVSLAAHHAAAGVQAEVQATHARPALSASGSAA